MTENDGPHLLTGWRRHLINLAATLFCVACSPGVAPAAEPPSPSTVAHNATLEEVYSDTRFFEGPTWSPKEGKLYFTAFAKAREDTQILRLESPGKVRVWLDRTEGVNGTCLGLDGRLIGAQAFGHRVMSYKLGEKGPRDSKVLLERPQLHQPNDICQAPNGNYYFTDPDFVQRRTSAVYLLRPSGELTKLISEMPLPNGLKVSLDGKTLFVGDSQEKLWRAFPILPNGITGSGKLFFDPPTEDRSDPDGMTLDEFGNLYFCGRGGVWVVTPKGESLGLIKIPEFCSNATFGDADGKALYLTCNTKLYRLRMNVRGSSFR